MYSHCSGRHKSPTGDRIFQGNLRWVQMVAGQSFSVLIFIDYPRSNLAQGVLKKPTQNLVQKLGGKSGIKKNDVYPHWKNECGQVNCLIPRAVAHTFPSISWDPERMFLWLLVFSVLSLRTRGEFSLIELKVFNRFRGASFP